MIVNVICMNMCMLQRQLSRYNNAEWDGQRNGGGVLTLAQFRQATRNFSKLVISDIFDSVHKVGCGLEEFQEGALIFRRVGVIKVLGLSLTPRGWPDLSRKLKALTQLKFRAWGTRARCQRLGSLGTL